MSARKNKAAAHKKKKKKDDDAKKTFVFDGELITDVDSFYQEVDKVLTNGKCRTGHNLDAFNDILRGGFGAFGEYEPIRLVWTRFSKCQKTLPKIEKVEEIIRCHDHIEFITTNDPTFESDSEDSSD